MLLLMSCQEPREDTRHLDLPTDWTLLPMYNYAIRKRNDGSDLDLFYMCLIFFLSFIWVPVPETLPKLLRVASCPGRAAE